MAKFTIPENVIKVVIGTAIPKPENEQNTDLIVPARFLKEITNRNMGKYVYADERARDGPSHPFNGTYEGATILVAGANYGCGSSREHAPQALHRFGIAGIIAESFAEIFARNCASIGVVPVTIPTEEISALAEYIQKGQLTGVKIDLEKKVVTYNGKAVTLDIPEGRRQAFLDGTWDALTVLQQDTQGIERTFRKLPYLGFE